MLAMWLKPCTGTSLLLSCWLGTAWAEPLQCTQHQLTWCRASWASVWLMLWKVSFLKTDRIRFSNLEETSLVHYYLGRIYSQFHSSWSMPLCLCTFIKLCIHFLCYQKCFINTFLWLYGISNHLYLLVLFDHLERSCFFFSDLPWESHCCLYRPAIFIGVCHTRSRCQ